MSKVSIILFADSVEGVKMLWEKVLENKAELDIEAVTVTGVLKDLKRKQLTDMGIKFAETFEELSFAQKANIGRNLISADSKYLLFLSGGKDISEKWLTDRVHPFDVEKSIGIVGVMGETVAQEIERKLYQRLVRFIHINQNDFKQKCCLPDGTIRRAVPESLATTTYLWDIDRYSLFPVPFLWLLPSDL